MRVLFQELQENTKFYGRHFEAIGVKTQIILFISTTIYTSNLKNVRGSSN